VKSKRYGNHFAINRKIFDSDIWQASPWTLKIWIYLLGRARWETEPDMWLGVKYGRGQLVTSLRRIMNACSYKIGYRKKRPSLTTVRRICEELTKALRITMRTVHCGTLVTICNYDKYQPQKNTNGTTNGTTNEQVVVHRTVQCKEGCKKVKEERTTDTPLLAITPPPKKKGTKLSENDFVAMINEYPSLNTEAIRAGWKEWVEWKYKEGKGKLSGLSAKKNLNLLAKTPNDAIAMMDNCIRGGWQGVWATNERTGQTSGNPNITYKADGITPHDFGLSKR